MSADVGIGHQINIDIRRWILITQCHNRNLTKNLRLMTLCVCWVCSAVKLSILDLNLYTPLLYLIYLHTGKKMSIHTDVSYIIQLLVLRN